MLHTPPIASPADAVRATILHEQTDCVSSNGWARRWTEGSVNAALSG
jgi:hypothetical protein